ncbi:type III secretion inner membrane ring lipoprotein SctJ [Pseudomonas sp. FP603]|nr:type III secretion inner membrane ring lipoprotein SctJ [Pseudomonas sp. FP603]WLI10721.1 type III secretion inner membrane ring lipoprotein SctJ [Pseudomonas sp. FP603]
MKIRWPCLLLYVLLLSGCSDVTDLFGELSERDANDVVAKLNDHRIDAHKRQEKKGVAIVVATSDLNRAVRLLDAAGLPKRLRTSLGEIFKKEGVISTPLEERARYIYALSQELEATLSQVDGVIVARVHVVLPERIAPGERIQPASAAVFVKHSSALDPDSVRGRIQQMVASSLPGMSGETSDSKKISIVFVPAGEFQETERLVEFGPFFIDSRNLGFWKKMTYGGVLLLPLLIAALMLSLRADWRRAAGTRLRSAWANLRRGERPVTPAGT